MNDTFGGSCMCGEVRYRCKSEPVATVVCHCRDWANDPDWLYRASVLWSRGVFGYWRVRSFHHDECGFAVSVVARFSCSVDRSDRNGGRSFRIPNAWFLPSGRDARIPDRHRDGYWRMNQSDRWLCRVRCAGT